MTSHRLLPILGLADALAATACSHRSARDDAHRVSAAIGDLKSADLDVVGGADTVTVRGADLGDDLFQASTPDDSRARPSVANDHGTVTLHLVDADRPQSPADDRTPGTGPAALDIRLSTKVVWRLHLDGGAKVTTIDFGAGRLAGLDLSAGSTRIDVVLPSPQGTVPVRMAGGASEFDLRAPAGVPTQVRLGGGAGSVKLDGVSHSGVSGGTLFTPPDWSGATDRYDIDATGGVSELTLTRT